MLGRIKDWLHEYFRTRNYSCPHSELIDTPSGSPIASSMRATKCSNCGRVIMVALTYPYRFKGQTELT